MDCLGRMHCFLWRRRSDALALHRYSDAARWCDVPEPQRDADMRNGSLPSALRCVDVGQLDNVHTHVRRRHADAIALGRDAR